MILTDKCKEDFKRWFIKKNYLITYVTDEDGNTDDWSLKYDSEFIKLPHSMQYGVCVDFFDGVMLSISVFLDDYEWIEGAYHWNIKDADTDIILTYKEGFKTRQEARTEAIKQANEIYNKK